MIKRFEFTPILGWSVSRYDIFQPCKRAYFYTYYAKYDDIHPRQRIDALKKMTTVPLEVGNTVHKVIEVLLKRLLKTEAEIDAERLLDYAYRRTKEHCETKIFSETYYNEMPEIDVEELFQKVEKCLNNFMGSDRFDWLTREAVKNKQKWLIEPEGYGETRIDGLKAYCKVDFLFPMDGKIYVLDWKTGKPVENKHKKQLKGYSSWASFHLSKDPTDIIPIIAYLQPTYSEKEVVFNEFDLQDFSIQVKRETEEMYTFCTNIEQNIPMDKEKFAKTNNQKVCAYCNFRELCQQPFP